MARITKTPGVCIISPKPGYPWQLSFYHPLRNKQQVKRSTRTTDYQAAEALAKELSGLLNSPERWQHPEGLSAFVNAMWTVEDGSSKASPELQAMLRATYEQAADLHLSGEYDPDNPASKNLLSPDSTAEHPKLLPISAKAFSSAEHANKTMLDLRDENATLKAEVDKLRRLVSQLSRGQFNPGMQRPIADAKDDYLAKLDKRNIRLVRSLLTRFVASLPPATMVAAVTSAHVVSFIEPMTVASKEQYCMIVAQFLSKVSGGTFNRQGIIEWIRHQRHAAARLPRLAPYWLNGDVPKLLAAMQGWQRDAAELQWLTGLRPEELSRLTPASIHLHDDQTGDMRVEVKPLYDVSGKLLWKAKTPGSYGRVHVPPEGRKLLARLAKAKTLTLFPCGSISESGAEEWCHEYLTELRRAAKAVNEKDEAETFAADRIDSRTMRRSAGKRVLVNSGYNLGIAAAFLRDTVETVRTHYASVLPSDIVQPKM